ncbi:hypothetical protein [Laceyella putida]|uniref:Uncharacterized protein n=1 Tax=Laceyella putida TaxID=110101 RepID=A0ABW2RH43_9BACL
MMEIEQGRLLRSHAFQEVSLRVSLERFAWFLPPPSIFHFKFPHLPFIPLRTVISTHPVVRLMISVRKMLFPFSMDKFKLLINIFNMFTTPPLSQT